MIKIASFVFNDFTHDSRVLKEAVSLKNAGYDITVVAHGNKNLEKEDTIQNIRVKRFSYFNRKVTKNIFSKLMIYIQYVLASVVYAKSCAAVHCNDLNTLPIGYIIKKFYNKDVKIIYDAHEYETEVGNLSGMAKKFMKFLEGYLIKHADKVITVSDSIAEEYAKLYAIPKPDLVLNTPPYQKIEKKDIFRQTFEISKEETIFLYQGGLSRGRGIEVLLDTFKSSGLTVVFMGYGPLEPLVKQYANEYKNIYFHNAVKPEVLLDYTSSADVGISTIENSCLSYYYCLPNKIFEYLMADIPVIVSNLYEMRKLVEEQQVGVVLEENSPEGLKGAITKVLALDKSLLKENIKKMKKIYNWEEQEKSLIKVYKDVLA